MALNVGFQTNPLSKLNVDRDTTLSIAQEAQVRGHKIFFFTPSTLQVLFSHASQPGVLTAVGHEAFFDSPKDYAPPFKFEVGPLHSLDLSLFDVLFIRQDPPVDMHYITNTYLLDLLPSRTWVINNPSSVRNGPEKLLPFFLPHLMPPTLISSTLKDIMLFLKTHKKVVCKALYNGAGRDIFLLQENDPNCASLLDHLLENPQAPYLFQKYLREIDQGDTRILIFDGKVLGAYKRFAQKDFRSNEIAGGALRPHELSLEDQKIVSQLIPFLQERNILFAGVDLIGQFVTEINITSPSGIIPLQKLYGTKPQEVLWNSIEKRLRTSFPSA